MKSLKISDLITRVETDSFKQYLKDVSMIKPITKDEEVALIDRLRNGDESVKNELVIRNLRFVISVAKKYHNGVVTIEDLVNEGNIGLIVATNKYDVNSGFKFISYAVWWIRKYIIEYLNNDSKMIRLPNHKVNYVTTIHKKISELDQKNGYQSSFGELVKTDSIDVEKDAKISDLIYEYESLANIYHNSVDSLNKESFNNDGDSSTLEDSLSDTSIFKETDNNLMVENQKTSLMAVLNKLKERDKKVMVLLFGLDGNPALTLKETAEEVNLSSEMVRIIKEKTISKLKKKLNRDMFVF
jgi:RNA polymerase primary sigma factor